MSLVVNNGVKINCKSVTTQLFIVLIVELGTPIEKSKGCLE